MKVLPIQRRWRIPAALLVMASFPSLAGPAGAAVKSARLKTAVATLPRIQLTSSSTPVLLASVLKARKPVKVGVVSYVLGSTGTSHEISVVGTPDGSIAWTAVERGRTQTRLGIIPAAKVMRMARGSVCVVVQTGEKAKRVAAGEQRYLMFYQFSPDHKAMLLLAPAPLPGTPVRTAFTIRGKTGTEEETRPKPLPGGMKGGPPMGGMGGHGGAVKWLHGAKGYETAMKQHAAKQKAVTLYFHDPKSMQCRQLDSEVFSACRAQEIFARVSAVKISPSQGAAEKALAARYGVKAYPSIIVIPAKSGQPRWVLPEPGGQKPGKGQGKGGMPCHVTDKISMALASKK